MSNTPTEAVASNAELGTEKPLVERLRTDVLWHRRRGNDTIALDCQNAADEIERLRDALKDYFSATDAAWLEICKWAATQGVTWVPVLPCQAKAMEKYNELRRAFWPNAAGKPRPASA